mmetsp:Transcript_9622/g.32822  ORF Transcript_9622/g.32822 Transcript_9622/m.32822 type:complete len:250 (-) Transcript_9622:1648-2397(-)
MLVLVLLVHAGLKPGEVAARGLEEDEVLVPAVLAVCRLHERETLRKDAAGRSGLGTLADHLLGELLQAGQLHTQGLVGKAHEAERAPLGGGQEETQAVDEQVDRVEDHNRRHPRRQGHGEVGQDLGELVAAHAHVVVDGAERERAAREAVGPALHGELLVRKEALPDGAPGKHRKEEEGERVEGLVQRLLRHVPLGVHRRVGRARHGGGREPHPQRGAQTGVGVVVEDGAVERHGEERNEEEEGDAEPQ